MDEPPKPKRTRRSTGRTKDGCRTCKGRRKKCPLVFNAQGVCERCEIGGFTCIPGTASIPAPRPAKAAPPLSASNTPPESANVSAQLLGRAEGMSLGSLSHPTTLPPAPTSISAATSTSAMQIEDFIPTISSAAAAASEPFNLNSTLAPSYPLSPFPSYLDSKASNALTTTSINSPDYSYNPLHDLSYSTALLAMFHSLPPTMPPAGSSAMMGDGPGALARQRQKEKKRVKGSGLELRTMMIREAMKDLKAAEEKEGALHRASSSPMERVADYYTDADNEWLSSFPDPERELVKEHIFRTIQSHPSSRASCLAAATALQLRLLPAEDVDGRRRIIEQGRRYFESAMEKMVDAPLITQLSVLMDSLLHQTEQIGPSAGYTIQSLIDAFISSHPAFSSFYTSIPPRRPRPYLASGSGQLNFLLRGLSCMDALRALALGDRRTFFDLSTTTLPSGETDRPLTTFELVPGVLVREGDEFFGGVAPFLVFKAAEICEVAMDVKEGLIGSVELKRKAEMLERELREWVGPRMTVLLQVEEEEETCEKRRLEIEKAREMWREALLIAVHQLLLHHTPLHPSNRASLARIISLGTSASPPTPPCSHPPSTETPESAAFEHPHRPVADSMHILERSLPWFFAATVAVGEEDRRIVLQALSMRTPFFGGRNAPLAELIWKRADEDGVLDWRQTLKEAGILLMLAQ
ncbi:hypothetical protein BCR35DRAFT_335701 [Leucosporidium creatinivorum]|uniref:Zn(2)-C6 fungal-type domain-containing protein n=1 Tax=Leucosporidium creatinivorum TaxID=106004 RepID=A0A1Y2D6E7_9BASI|nr:hypothetical protein BCR35DRAFT_335701 [Leucosporidium creatinivorum]